MYANGITLLQHNNYLELTRNLYVQTYFINTTRLFNRINLLTVLTQNVFLFNLLF